MKKTSLSLLLLFVAGLGHSQPIYNHNVWHLIVADNSSLLGIEGVTVKIEKKYTLFSDLHGEINIEKSTLDPGDSIKISCIGYRKVSLLITKNFKYPDSIKLVPAITNLNEVKIDLRSAKQIVLGDIKKVYNTHSISVPDYENARYIPNDKKIRGTIVSAEFVLNDELHGIDQPFAVQLYSKDKDDLFPDQMLIKDTLIVYNPKRKKKVSVDVSKYNIQFPDNGVIVVFATLPSHFYPKDSSRYYKGPYTGQWFLKIPGIDMDLKEKDSYQIDPNKQNTNEPYSMVRAGPDKLNWENIKDQFYVFAAGNNFAISITVDEQ